MDTQTKSLWRAWHEQRDEAAFEALVRPELPALYDVARRIGLTSADAEDVVQDALAALAREDSRRPGDVGVGAWLMRTVRFRALTARRSLGRRARHESDVAPRTDVRAPEFDVRDEIETALARLPDDDRQILLFRFVYDLDYREIAYVLGVSENACRIRVHRATGRLREGLGPKAPALLAALPLADLPQTAQAIAAAAKAATATSGVALIGGLVVSTTAKMAAAALVAAALTAGAFLEFGQPDPGDAGTGAVDEPVTNPIETVGAGPMLEGQGQVPKRLVDLGPNEDELAFLRIALEGERKRRAAAVVRPGDSGLDILTRVFEHGMDPWPLMKDSDGFQSHVKPSPDTPVVVDTMRGHVREVELSELASSLVEFGPGTYRVSVRRFRIRKPIEHLEIRGAGMDETTLIFDEHLMVTAAMQHLRISDLTLDYENRDELLDVRDRAAAAFENVRFRDWSGGGFGSVIGVSGHAYVFCRGCEFVDTDGRGGQFAINFRGPALAVLERCAFKGVRRAIMATGEGKGSRARLVDCTFEECALTDTRILDTQKQPTAEIRVEGAHATYGPPNWTDEMRHEHWGAPLATVSGLTLDATIRRVTVGDLIEVLRAIDVPLDEQVFTITLAAWGDDGPAAFSASTHADGNERPKVYTIHRPDRVWTLRHEPRGGGAGYWVWPDFPAPLDLLLALEKSGIAADMLTNGVSLQRYGSQEQPKEKRLNFYTVGSMTDGILIDATTGQTLTWDELSKR